jgi:hypothetical protein
MAKITKRKALEKCIELWGLLAKMEVADWPVRAKHDAAGKTGCADYDCYCPCCEYVTSNGLVCDDCPIEWGGEKEEFSDRNTCGDVGAEWDEWVNHDHTSEERKQLALAIVKKAEEALAALPKRKKAQSEYIN